MQIIVKSGYNEYEKIYGREVKIFIISRVRCIEPLFLYQLSLSEPGKFSYTKINARVRYIRIRYSHILLYSNIPVGQTIAVYVYLRGKMRNR